MNENHSGENFFKGLLFGVLGGALLGVLFAPAPGEETRKKLKEKGTELKDKALKAADNLEEVVGPWIEDTKEDIKDVVEKLEDASEPAREAVKEKLEDLEKDLARTKKNFFKKAK